MGEDGAFHPYCTSRSESTAFEGCRRAVGAECAAFTETSDGTCQEEGVKGDGEWCVLPDGQEAACHRGTCSSCVPDCEGRSCGSDGCGATCGVCDPGETCAADGQCRGCEPDCGFRTCGDDGCGGSCGDCGDGETCGGDGRCGPAPCADDTDCDGGCLDLTPCLRCVCLDARCVTTYTDGCCEDDTDCDDGQACDPATNACYRVCSSDADCAGECGTLTACDRCRCGGDTGDRCVTSTTPLPLCCTAAGDCDDGLTCTLDACVENTCVSTPNEHGECLHNGSCLSGCFDNFAGCPCDGQPFGGCTSADQACAELNALLDSKYCVHHCGGACCLDDADCAEPLTCRGLAGAYVAPDVAGPSAALGTCVPAIEPPACWLDDECAGGETCAGVITCPACHRAGEDGCVYAPGTCTPAP